MSLAWTLTSVMPGTAMMDTSRISRKASMPVRLPGPPSVPLNTPDFLPDPARMTFSPVAVYGVRLLYLAISMVLIALGILFYLAPNLISLPGEGIMQVIAHKLDKPLPVIKMCFDCTVSLIALAISLAYFRQFHGIREGTVIAAFGVGKILGLYDPLKPALHRFMHGLEVE